MALLSVFSSSGWKASTLSSIASTFLFYFLRFWEAISLETIIMNASVVSQSMTIKISFINRPWFLTVVIMIKIMCGLVYCILPKHYVINNNNIKWVKIGNFLNIIWYESSYDYIYTLYLPTSTWIKPRLLLYYYTDILKLYWINK